QQAVGGFLPMKRYSSKACTVILLVAFLSGCGTLFNPYVSWELKNDGGDLTIDSAIEYANDGKEKYREAISDQSMLTSGLGTSLIVLSAAAIGAALLGESDVAIGIGLGGATAFAVGSWLSAPVRQRIYIAGVKGLNCAVESVHPLWLPESKSNKLDEDLAALPNKIADLESQLRQVEKIREQYRTSGASSLLPEANANVQHAEQILAAAQQSYADGVSLQTTRSQAGFALKNAVDRIKTEVDTALITTESSLQNIPEIVGSLSSLSTQFMPPPGIIPEAPLEMARAPEALVRESTAVKEARRQLLLEALDQLDAATKEVSILTQSINAVLSTVSSAVPIAALKSCGVPDEQFIQPLRIQPLAPIVFRDGGTRRIIIEGGRAPYSAMLMEQPVDGLEVTQATPFGPLVTIRLDAEKKLQGDFNLLVNDGGGRHQSFVIRIEPPVSGPGAPDAAATRQPMSATDFLRGSSETNLLADDESTRKKIQRALCVDDDGKFGPKTRIAIKFFQQASELEVAGELNEQEIASLKTDDQICERGSKNFFEKGLSESDVRAVRKALGLPEEPVQLDQASREKIESFANQAGLMPKDVAEPPLKEKMPLNQLWKELKQAIIDSVPSSGTETSTEDTSPGGGASPTPSGG
ncbi:MAG: hypothetical protein KJP06_04895, partial [Deltaproteobacteria bacterium]|nr:hypothetical protein [Deltaproteobacteria bacterium]